LIQWIIGIGTFILFWLLRAWYFHNKLQQTKKYRQIFVEYVNSNANVGNISRHKSAIISLFEQAGIKDFVVSKMQPAGLGYVQTFDLKGFDNIHLIDFQVATNIQTKFDEAIGSFDHKMKQSFNPFFWIESIIYLPKNMINYIAPNSSNGGFIKVLQIIFWIAMILFGLHNTNLIDITQLF